MDNKSNDTTNKQAEFLNFNNFQEFYDVNFISFIQVLKSLNHSRLDYFYLEFFKNNQRNSSIIESIAYKQ